MDLIRTGRHEVRDAERGQEVVERLLVGHVDDAEAQADLRLVAVKQVVDAEAEVDEVPWRDARRVVTSSAVSSAGMISLVAPPPQRQLLVGVPTEATMLPQKKPMAPLLIAGEGQRVSDATDRLDHETGRMRLPRWGLGGARTSRCTGDGNCDRPPARDPSGSSDGCGKACLSRCPVVP